MPGGVAATGSGLGSNAAKGNGAGLLMVGFAAFAGILYGYDTGTIGGITAMKDWLRLFGEPTTDTDTHPTGFFLRSGRQSLVTSILSAGTFVGKPCLYTKVIHGFLRRAILLLQFRRSRRWPRR